MKINSLKHKRGRPTKMGQIQIQRELRPYFEKGISASVTAEKTGIDPKTVNNHFDDWAEAILEVEQSKSLERQEIEKARITTSYDYLLLDAYRHFDDIDDQINQLKKEKKPVTALRNEGLLGTELELKLAAVNLAYQQVQNVEQDERRSDEGETNHSDEAEEKGMSILDTIKHYLGLSNEVLDSIGRAGVLGAGAGKELKGITEKAIGWWRAWKQSRKKK